MMNPPAAVEIVLEAVMILLTGKVMSFHDTRRLLKGGEAFLLMLKTFDIEDITDHRLGMVEGYVDNPVFRPEHVEPVSLCASKFCTWVLGVVSAARWQRGVNHKRTDFTPQNKDHLPPKTTGNTTRSVAGMSGSGLLVGPSRGWTSQSKTAVGSQRVAPQRTRTVGDIGQMRDREGSIDGEESNIPFHQKLAREKAKRLRQGSAEEAPTGPLKDGELYSLTKTHINISIYV
jgi:hypothetical protein